VKRVTVIIIDGKEVEFEKIPAKKRAEIVNELNRRALSVLGYEQVKNTGSQSSEKRNMS